MSVSIINVAIVLYYPELFTPTPAQSCRDGQLRLGDDSVGSAGAFYHQGRVEVCINNTYGAICDVGWDQLDAQVACRDLGYNSTNFGR